jgi:hypothetical protein
LESKDRIAETVPGVLPDRSSDESFEPRCIVVSILIFPAPGNLFEIWRMLTGRASQIARTPKIFDAPGKLPFTFGTENSDVSVFSHGSALLNSRLRALYKRKTEE